MSDGSTTGRLVVTRSPGASGEIIARPNCSSSSDADQLATEVLGAGERTQQVRAEQR